MNSKQKTWWTRTSALAMLLAAAPAMSATACGPIYTPRMQASIALRNGAIVEDIEAGTFFARVAVASLERAASLAKACGCDASYAVYQSAVEEARQAGNAQTASQLQSLLAAAETRFRGFRPDALSCPMEGS